MKAFIFVALVASVAARSLDLETLRLVNKEKSLLNTPVVKVGDDLLLKEQLKQNVIVGQDNLIDSTIVPVQQEKIFGGIYDNVVDTDRVLSLQELYTTGLFREYLSIPLFRQYIQYPSFQRFVSSVYFQRFWQLPAYKQYFVNPVLFYKYVYPIVQLFNTEYTLPSNVYGQTEDVLGLQTLVDNVLLKNRNYLPYAYNRFSVPTTSFQGTTTNYKFLLDKLSKNLINKQQLPIDYQVKTDVKLIPTEKVVIEPITNKQVVVEEPKIVDVKVDQKIVPVVDTIVPVATEQVLDSVVITERDVLLLKQLLKLNIITPEIYQGLLVGKFNYVTLLRQVLVRGQVSADLVNEIVARLQVIDTVVPTTDSVVLTERNLVILKDLLKKDFITPEVYKSVLVGQVEFTTLIRQVLERRGLTIELINQIINRLITIDTTITTEQDFVILKDLLRQNVISQEIFQSVLFGKLDFFTVLRQVIIRRDVIDTIYPVDTEVVLTQRHIVLLKELVQQNIISEDIFKSVLVGKLDFTLVLRQVLERRGITSDLVSLIIRRFVTLDIEVPLTTETDIVILKELLRQNLISQELYQFALVGKLDFFTLLRQIIFRRDVVDTVFPYATTSKINRFDVFDKYFGGYGYNKYNTEIPTIRDTTFNYNNNYNNRFPIVA